MSGEPIALVTVLAVLVAAAVVFGVLVVGITRSLFGRGRRLEAELGIEVLDDRLARGEITREEYATARRALGR